MTTPPWEVVAVDYYSVYETVEPFGVTVSTYVTDPPFEVGSVS